MDQQKTLLIHSLEDQFELFIFGNQIRHPPATYLAECFALNGGKAVDLIRSKLRENSSDLTVRDIVMLLSVIDEMRMYDVANDAELMAALNVRVAQMSNKDWHSWAEGQVAKIGNERNDFPSMETECGLN